MIIKNLTLRSFGKFKDKSIDFKDRLNIMYGENESGKSTVSTALKTYFYSAGSVKNKYKRSYIPLGDTKGTFDVSATLNTGEDIESYITLGQTPAKTFIKTVKKPLDEPFNTGDLPMGEYLFSVDEEMFDSVFYIKDLSSYSLLRENKEAVSAELSKTNANTVIDVDVSKILDDIKTELNQYTRQTATGRIFPYQEKLLDIEKALFNLNDINESIKGIENNIQNAEEKIEKNSNMLISVKEKAEYAKKYDEYVDTVKQLELREKIRKTEEKLTELKTEKPEIPQNELEILKSYSGFDFSKVKTGKNCFIAAAAVLLLTVALSFMSYLFTPLTAVGAYLIVLGVSKNKRNKKLKEEENKYKEILKTYNVKDIDDYNLKVKEALKNEYEAKVLEKELSYLKQGLKEYNSSYLGVCLDKPESDLKTILAQEERLNQEIFSLKLEITRLKEQKKNAFNNLPDFEALTEEKEELIKKINRLNAEFEVAKDAYDILLKTSKSFKASYIPYLNDKVKEILNNIMDTKVDYFSIKDNFLCEVRTGDGAEIKNQDYLSSGTGDLVNFALRLAIYELICEEQAIPLILDDPFIELDDIRFEKIMKYLNDNFKNQIIYFTAHKRIFNLTLENSTVVVI